MQHIVALLFSTKHCLTEYVRQNVNLASDWLLPTDCLGDGTGQVGRLTNFCRCNMIHEYFSRPKMQSCRPFFTENHMEFGMCIFSVFVDSAVCFGQLLSFTAMFYGTSIWPPGRRRIPRNHYGKLLTNMNKPGEACLYRKTRYHPQLEEDFKWN